MLSRQTLISAAWIISALPCCVIASKRAVELSVKPTTELVELLRSEDAVDRKDALHALSLKSPPVTGPIAEAALSDRDATVRREAIELLGSKCDTRTSANCDARVAYSLNIAIDDKDSRNGLESAVAAIRVNAVPPEGAIAKIDSILRGPDFDLRTSALLDFGELGHRGDVFIPAITELINDSDRHNRELAFGALSLIGKASVPVLIRFLDHRDENLQLEAALVLAELAPDTSGLVEHLSNGLRNRDADYRKYSAHACAFLNQETAQELMPELEELLGDPEEEVRDSARNAIQKLSDKK